MIWPQLDEMLFEGDIRTECAEIEERGDRRFFECLLHYTAHLGPRKPNVAHAQIELHCPYPPIESPCKNRYSPPNFITTQGDVSFKSRNRQAAAFNFAQETPHTVSISKQLRLHQILGDLDIFRYFKSSTGVWIWAVLFWPKSSCWYL